MSQVPISTIVNVQISRETRAVTQAGFGVPLILTDEDTGWAGDRIRTYVDSDEVLEDFASSSDTYKAAAAIFSQKPKVEELKIGAEGDRVAQIQTIVFSAAIVTGNTIAITVDDVDLTQAFDTNNATTLTALAAQIQAEPGVATAASNGSNTITVTSATPGVPTSLSDAVITGGASQALIVIATTTANHGPADDLAEIREIDDDWYGVIWIERGAELVLEMARYIETQRKIFITANDTSGVLVAATTTDVASILQAKNYDRTSFIWNDDPLDFIDGGWMGKNFPFDPGNETWKFKTLNGITADILTSSQRTAAKDKNANIYVKVGGIDITQEGVMASGEYIDIIRGVDWLQARMEERVFALLAKLPKVPFTDAGIGIIEAEIRAVLVDAINSKLIANEPFDPDLDQNEPFIVSAPRARDVSANDRANRFLPDVTFAARLAGAIHKTTIQGVVTI
jgi:hypothetical protein